MDDPSATSASASESQQQWTEPPWVGFLETTEDALLILEAARRRLIPRVTRRLADRERKLINSGSVFVFEEEESGIKRWTDGFLWSPSRILGNFLLYRETDKRNPDGTPATRPGRSNTTSLPSTSNGGASSLLVSEDPTPVPYPSGALSRPKEDLAGGLAGGYSAAGSSGLDRARERILLGSLTNSQKFKEDGMMKKTFSLTLPNTTQTHHIVSYYKVADVEAGRLRTPSSLPEFAALEISPEFLDKTHFRVQPRVEVGEDGRVRFRGETNDEPDSPSPEPSKELAHSSAPTAVPHHHPSHGGSNVVVGTTVVVPAPTSHGAHHSSHPYQRPQSHHGSSSAASHYSASIGSTNSYSGFGPSSSANTVAYPAGRHSRQNSLSATSTAGSLDYSTASSTTVGGLAAAAKAQAEASARMYMNGAAIAAAASTTSSSSSSKQQQQFHQQQQAQGYFPNGTPVGSTASSLGLHYPSALSNYNSSSASSSVSPPPPPPASSYAGSATSHTSHSSARSNYSYDSYTSAYTNDNATGAPPFQAPQLYNPNQPSAASNAQFATTSYPPALAPNRRAANSLSSTTPSVRSGMSMSTTTSAAFEATNDATGAAVRGSRSGSRGSTDSASISSGPGSLVSSSTAASSEVATPSIASSSRRSSAGLMSSRPDPLTLNKMLAAVKPEQSLDEEAVVVNGYGDLGFDAMNMNMNMMNMSFNGAAGGYGAMGMEDALGLGMDTMIMSPVQDVGLGDDQPPMTATAATWCGATPTTNGYDMSAASSFQQQSYIDQQSPSHTSSGAYYTTTAAANTYTIPPPPTRQKSMPSYPASSVYGTYQYADQQQQQQYYQHPGMMRATTMYEPSATSYHGALGGEQ